MLLQELNRLLRLIDEEIRAIELDDFGYTGNYKSLIAQRKVLVKAIAKVEKILRRSWRNGS